MPHVSAEKPSLTCLHWQDVIGSRDEQLHGKEVPFSPWKANPCQDKSLVGPTWKTVMTSLLIPVMGCFLNLIISVETKHENHRVLFIYWSVSVLFSKIPLRGSQELLSYPYNKFWREQEHFAASSDLIWDFRSYCVHLTPHPRRDGKEISFDVLPLYYYSACVSCYFEYILNIVSEPKQYFFNLVYIYSLSDLNKDTVYQIWYLTNDDLIYSRSVQFLHEKYMNLFLRELFIFSFIARKSLLIPEVHLL